MAEKCHNPDFTILFDGNSLDGWNMEGKGNFRTLEEAALQSEGGMGVLWYTKKEYRNFILKLDWKVLHRKITLAYLYDFHTQTMIQWWQ